MQYNADGSGGRVYAKGLRNAVGFVQAPGSDELWATNNGRDGLGDDIPPETINLVRDGNDFGWPYCHNGRIKDKEFGRLGSCDKVTRPAFEMQAHSAPLGLTFYPAAPSCRLQQRPLRRLPRLLEPHHPHRLQGHPGALHQRPAHRQDRGLHHRLARRKRQRLGPPRRRQRRPRRQPLHHRRRPRHRLPRQHRRSIARRQENLSPAHLSDCPTARLPDYLVTCASTMRPNCPSRMS
ncbi:MAG: PQQ-dependent sugar dehydrogenase [Chloroflexia bacterium]